MTAPLVLYQNRIEETTATISVTSEAAGFAKENAYDWLTHDFWKPTASGTVYYTIDLGSAKSCDAWGVAAHDLGNNSATIKLQYSSDNFSADINDVGTAVSPSAGEPIMKIFSSVSSRYWRFQVVSSTVASKIGVLMLGPRLTLDDRLVIGYAPDKYAQEYESEFNISGDAVFLGISTRKKPIRGSLNFTLLTQAWVDANWLPFTQHLEQGKGFLWLPQYDTYPNYVTWAYMDNSRPAPISTHADKMQVSLPYVGVIS